jgi:iron complex outermembrane receptor protein
MSWLKSIRSEYLKGVTAIARWRPTAALISRIVAAACMTLKVTAVIAADTATGPVSPADFSRMTLEDLANVEISSVSKRPERLSNAAASVYVISRDDIRHSGATNIPEILRLAPNLQVARVDSSQYAISARGFNSTTANKLLVLIDGRSVYTPFFSGEFWDVQDTLIEDIERVEVISGPGAVQWGSNAVNGVINIITRHTRDTTGGLVSAGAGSDERGGAVRYGGKLGESGSYRIYAKNFNRDDTVRANGASAQDAWRKSQLGFRVDWAQAGDGLTLQGDVYDGSIDQPINNDKTISGHNLLARWNRTLADGSAIQLQTYYDKTRRIYPGTFGEVLETYDIDAQHRFRWGKNHDIIWGGGYRMMRDDVTNTAALAFLPAQRDLYLGNIFVQDTMALGERLQFTLGARLEHNSYTGWEIQPNVRLGWTLAANQLLWSAISRAVRTPSRLDRDFFVPGSAPFLIAGGPNFQSEKLTAYEIGYRAQPFSGLSYSISTFYNAYDELRSIEAAVGGGLPFVLSNTMKGSTYGIEMWGSYRVRDWWQLKAGYNYLKKDLRFTPGSRDVSGVQAAGNDPAHQFSVRSTMNLGNRTEFDVSLRSIGALPNPNVPAYVALDARLGWRVAKDLEVSIAGFNLLDNRHPEFGALPARSEIGRNIYARILWTF